MENGDGWKMDEKNSEDKGLKIDQGVSWLEQVEYIALLSSEPPKLQGIMPVVKMQ